jgi:hypothetical protein
VILSLFSVDAYPNPFHPLEEEDTDTSLSKRAASFRALANLTPLTALRNRFQLLLDDL